MLSWDEATKGRILLEARELPQPNLLAIHFEPSAEAALQYFLQNEDVDSALIWLYEHISLDGKGAASVLSSLPSCSLRSVDVIKSSLAKRQLFTEAVAVDVASVEKVARLGQQIATSGAMFTTVCAAHFFSWVCVRSFLASLPSI